MNKEQKQPSQDDDLDYLKKYQKELESIDQDIRTAALENAKLHYIMALNDELIVESTIDFAAGVEWQKIKSLKNK